MRNNSSRRFEKKIIRHEQLAIKQIRRDLKLTLKGAGQKIGVSEKTIGAIENGRINLSKERLENILESYEIKFLDFIRVKKVIARDILKTKKREAVRHVLSNSDRRSYQKIITRECEVIRSMRRIKNLSQDQASKLCGYSRSSIGHIENGRIELTIERIKHIVCSYGYKFKDYEDYFSNDEFRDQIIDRCIEKIRELDDFKLSVVKNLLVTL